MLNNILLNIAIIVPQIALNSPWIYLKSFVSITPAGNFWATTFNLSGHNIPTQMYHH